jgi:hypothetical protein
MDWPIYKNQAVTRTRINWYFLGSLLALGASAAAWVNLARWVLR